MLDAQSLGELRNAFVAESEEGLFTAEQAALVLERSPDDDAALGELFRAIHTLKGNAGIFDLAALTAVAHGMEELLDRIRDRSILITPPIVSHLLLGIDLLRSLLSESMSRELSDAERDYIAGTASLRAGQQSARAATADARWRRQGRTVRIDLSRLDRLLDLTGEIGVARGRVNELLEDGRTPREVALEAHRDAEQLHLELQEVVMKLRMVPVGPLFRQLVRTVRDTAAALGKEAELIIEGENVEVDLSIVESLKDPLVHMVRNSLDHGIEMPEARMACGKRAAGRILLRSYHDAGSIVIELQDDGAGLDRDRILGRARERGLIAPDATLTETQILQLVFEPGFSTAESVTELSGRGVGLDVVRRNIQAIHGQVAIVSESGKGTTMTIRLPLTLAVIDGLLVGSLGESYILPMQAVLETVRYQPEPGRNRVVSVRGEVIPLLPLWTSMESETRRRNVVVVHHAGGRAGLLVDVLHGECHAVVKPLSRTLRGIAGISGSAVLPSGQVALIVDIPGLLQAEINRSQGCLPV